MEEIRKQLMLFLIMMMIVSGAVYTAIAAANAAGSEATGSINGTVYDAAGNLVPDADVYLKDGQGSVTGLALTDGNGTYRFTELSPENHTVIVQVDGYSWFNKTTVKAGKNIVLDVHIPDYIHWPEVTPWPAPVNNSAPAGGTKVATPTPAPAPVPTSVAISVTPVPVVQNETSEPEGGGSPIDDFISGIVGFFKSLLGM